jgi:hypothetical protein
MDLDFRFRKKHYRSEAFLHHPKIEQFIGVGYPQLVPYSLVPVGLNPAARGSRLSGKTSLRVRRMESSWLNRWRSPKRRSEAVKQHLNQHQKKVLGTIVLWISDPYEAIKQ